ncbi:MAG: tRNA dimethylallyltransferase, partial [Solirubrobacteraceae bacterium]
LELLDSGDLEPPSGESELWTAGTRHATLLVGLVMDREQLYQRIDDRVDRMLADGVEDEVRGARNAGASDTARKALGFEDLLSGDVEQMKRRTRNYARRQLTWMRKLAGVTVIDRTGRTAPDIADQIFTAWRAAAAPSAAAGLRTPPRTDT